MAEPCLTEASLKKIYLILQEGFAPNHIECTDYILQADGSIVETPWSSFAIKRVLGTTGCKSINDEHPIVTAAFALWQLESMAALKDADDWYAERVSIDLFCNASSQFQIVNAGY